MTLSAYLPFFRSHDILSAIPQELYVWNGIGLRPLQGMASPSDIICLLYSASWLEGFRPGEPHTGVRNGGVLSIKYTPFVNASRHGTPIGGLSCELPDEPELSTVDIDIQSMIGNAFLVTAIWI